MLVHCEFSLAIAFLCKICPESTDLLQKVLSVALSQIQRFVSIFAIPILRKAGTATAQKIDLLNECKLTRYNIQPLPRRNMSQSPEAFVSAKRKEGFF